MLKKPVVGTANKKMPIASDKDWRKTEIMTDQNIRLESSSLVLGVFENLRNLQENISIGVYFLIN